MPKIFSISILISIIESNLSAFRYKSASATYLSFKHLTLGLYKDFEAIFEIAPKRRAFLVKPEKYVFVLNF